MFTPTCTRCPHRPTCGKRAKIIAAVKGLGLTTAQWDCEERYLGLVPGDRVSLKIFQDHNEPIFIDGEVLGTIMYRSRGKFRVWTDETVDEDGHRCRVRVWPCNLTPTGEPRLYVCPDCGRPENRQNRKEWYCERCNKKPE